MANLVMSTVTSSTAVVMVVGLLAMACAGQVSSAPPTTYQCDTTPLIPCLAFLAKSQPIMKPSPMCCNPVNAALKNETQRACLCGLLTDTELLKSSGVDPAKAATLPAMCNPAYMGVDVCAASPPPSPSAPPPAKVKSPPGSPPSGSASAPPKTQAPGKSSGFAIASTYSAGISGVLFAIFAVL